MADIELEVVGERADPALTAKEAKAKYYKYLRDNLFSEHPLDRPRQIRVLIIEQTTNENDPIIAKMDRVNLDNPTPYQALSYVWGNPKDGTAKIICCDVKVEVTSNCHTALLHLRKLQRLTIWIDAVCIDQDDEMPELGQQMSLMTRIYGAADSVFIWLGAGTPGTQKALKFMGTGSLTKYITIRDNEVKERCIRFALRLVRPWGSSYPSGKFIHWTRGKARTIEVVRLLDNEWLTRMWTYQEIVFSHNPIIVCGDLHVPFRIFQDKLLLLNSLPNKKLRSISKIWLGLSQARERMQNDNGARDFSRRHAFMQRALKYRFRFRMALHTFVILGQSGLMAFSIYARVTESSYYHRLNLDELWTGLIILTVFSYLINLGVILTQLGFEWVQRRSPISIGRIIDGICGRRASKRKDKVYGVWNILRELSKAASLTEALDQKLSEEKLYHRLAVELARSDGDTHVLHLAAICPMPCPDLPNWVPDWSSDFERIDIQYSLLEVDMSGYRISSEDKKTILLEEELRNNHIYISPDEKILTASARELGSVIACTTFYKIEPSKEDIDVLIRNARTGLRLIEEVRSLGGNIATLRELADPKNTVAKYGWQSWHFILMAENLNTIENSVRRMAREPQSFDPLPSFLTLHVKICNLLAELNLTVCTVKFHDKLTESTGFCLTGTVMPYDSLVRVSGLLRPLLVRKRMNEAATSVDLVSTLYMKARGGVAATDLSGLRSLEKFHFH